MTALLLLGVTALAAETPEEEEPEPSFPQASPYAAFVGGAAFEVVDRRDDDVDDREGRFWTPALARIGLAARLSEHWSLNSEVEFNAGPYGLSVWEGQASIQVRNQLIRYETTGLLGDDDRFALEVGRVTDPASLNYFSVNIANLLLSDVLARQSLLVGGFNRGNGVRAEYTIADALTAGVSVNAGNPTSNTATFAVGGTFPPFSRFFQVPWANVGRDARGFPSISMNTIVGTPSLRLNTDVIDAQAAIQLFSVNTNTASSTDENITGRNLRAGLRVKVPDNRFAVFGNFTQMLNDVVQLDDLGTLAEDEKYLGTTVSGGFDVRIGKRNGFGAQYDLVREEERGLEPIYSHYANAGVTVGLSDSVYMSGRFAMLQVCQEQDAVERCDVNGIRQGYLTMTAILGASRQAQP